MNQKSIISILAVIGALVVAGWVFRLALHLFVPIAVVGVCVVVYMALQDKKRIK